MSRQRTIHLSAKALEAIRPGDGVSARINQIIEHYQALMALDPLKAMALLKQLREQEMALPP